MLNHQLNRAKLTAAFGLKRRVQIEDALEGPVADYVADVLMTKTDWQLAVNRATECLTLSKAKIAELGRDGMGALLQECLQNARTGFQYVYSSYPIVDAILAQRDVGHPLHSVIEEINAPEFRCFIEDVTGIRGLVKADGQATLYTRGNFLTLHNDFDPQKNRRVAYVLNFTRRWRADWGGVLEFYDEIGNVECGFVPRFNVLNLFEVPANHAVTFVPPYVSEGRYSITGWFMGA